jgi:hypothetical protein
MARRSKPGLASTRTAAVSIRAVEAIVLVAVEHVAPVTSPAYDDGSSEAAVEERSLTMYGLSRSPPPNWKMLNPS